MMHLKKILVTGLALGAVAVGTTACTPDTTRGRVENDVPITFAHAYSLSEKLQGHRPVTPTVTRTECHSSVNTQEDSEPGSWDCQLAYTADGRRKNVDLLILIDQLGCYQALDGARRNAMITDVSTGEQLPDPKAGFDGCFDVYDNRTDTSKH
jgi:hypothetical protein